MKQMMLTIFCVLLAMFGRLLEHVRVALSSQHMAKNDCRGPILRITNPRNHTGIRVMTKCLVCYNVDLHRVKEHH